MKFEQISSRWQNAPVFVLMGYFLLTLLVTWPLAAELGQAIPGNGGDAWVHVWTFDWVKDAIATGQNPFYTERLFYPEGASLVFHNIAWVHILVWLPLQMIFGAAAAYTLVFLLIFAFNGFTTYLLAREYALPNGAAFVAGLVAAFWPYALSQNNHPNLIFVGWVPLILIYLRRTLQNGRKQDALLTAVFLALLGYTRWQLLVIAGALITVFVIYQLITDRELWSRYVMGLLLGIALAAGLLTLPLLTPLLFAQLTRDNPEELFVDENLEQTDLLAYVVPSLYHPLWGETVVSHYQSFESDKYAPYIGYTTLLLALLALIVSWRQARLWLFSALLLMLLALGPELMVNGEAYVALPYRWIQDWFLIKVVRRPDRFNVVLSIPFAMLAAYGVAWLQQQPFFARFSAKSISGQAALLCGLTIFILLETAVAFPTLAWEIPSWYEQRANDAEEYAILGIPAHPRSRFDKRYMFYQLAHNKPIVEGHISRPSAEVFQFIDQLPFFRDLRFGTGTEVPDEVSVSQQLRLLANANVRYLVLHKASLSPAALSEWRRWLVLPPEFEDDDVVVYNTDVDLATDMPFRQVLKRDDQGRVEVGLLEQTVRSTSQSNVWQIDVVWGSETGVENTYNVCFNLTTATNIPLNLRCKLLSALHPSTQWEPNEIVRASYQFEAHPGSIRDDYDMVMDLWQPGVGLVTDGKTAVASLHVEPDLNLRATWDDGLLLPTYDYALFSGDDTALELVFHWETSQKVTRNYKRFVHVIEAQSGQIVLQEDVVPGRATPTEAWERGASIADTVYLQLGHLGAGEYRILVGLYDEETGQRLPAYRENGLHYPDNSVLVGKVIRQ